jgi:lysophospholipase L1-like esterase
MRLTHDTQNKTAPSEAFAQGLANTVTRLERAGKKVSYLMQVPELGMAALDCLGRPLPLPGTVECRVPMTTFTERMTDYRYAVTLAVAKAPGLKVIDPSSLFCSNAECLGLQKKQLLYADDDHLNIFGARMVANLVWHELQITKP